MLDDVIGTGPMDRGTPVNPEKSATEARSITVNANKRNKQRLEVVAAAFSELFRVQHAYQRDVFGPTAIVPVGDRIRTIPVPDPETAAFTFEVDPIDIEHLSRRGEIEGLLAAIAQTTQTIGVFRGSIPRVIRELLRRYGKAVGIVDSDLMLDAPVLEQGPHDRYMKALQEGTSIQVSPQDDHEAYVAYYEQKVGEIAANPALGTFGGLPALQGAIKEHKLHLSRAQIQQTAPTGNQTNLGASDANAPALAAGAPPNLTPTTQIPNVPQLAPR
jgi:hypothetical protein